MDTWDNVSGETGDHCYCLTVTTFIVCAVEIPAVEAGVSINTYDSSQKCDSVLFDLCGPLVALRT